MHVFHPVHMGKKLYLTSTISDHIKGTLRPFDIVEELPSRSHSEMEGQSHEMRGLSLSHMDPPLGTVWILGFHTYCTNMALHATATAQGWRNPPSTLNPASHRPAFTRDKSNNHVQLQLFSTTMNDSILHAY